MNETQRNQIKGALLKCAEENENKPTFTGYVVVSSVCKSAAERIEELEKQLEAEKKLNEEIKVRFVKCNTCTDEMKSKCLMFSENLCEGDRCEELVDLIELMNKSDLTNLLTKAKHIIQTCLQFMPSGHNDMGNTDMAWEIRDEAEQFLKEIE